MKEFSPNIIISDIQDVESLREIVTILLNKIEEQHQEIIELKKENKQLKNEINLLKKEQASPDIKPNTNKDNTKDYSSPDKEKKNQEHKKKPKKDSIEIDETQDLVISKEELPSDAKFVKWDIRICQDIIFKRFNTKFRVAVYYSPSLNKTFKSPLPNGSSYFSSGLKSFVLMMNKICNVTTDTLLALLKSIGIEISKGSLINILLENTDQVEQERKDILHTGLQHTFVQTDITSARFKGQNQYCHIISNLFFTSYNTLSGKSLLNVLTAMQGISNIDDLELLFNQNALNIIKESKVSRKDIELLKKNIPIGNNMSLAEFDIFAKEKIPDIEKKRNTFIKIKDALALAYYNQQEKIPKVKYLVSDNAPEYNRISPNKHALCWIHEVRHYNKLVPYIKHHREILNDFIKKIWAYYDKLLAYKQTPSNQKIKELESEFDKLFLNKTGYFQLDQRIEKTYQNKDRLLTVLSCPVVPLHNNDAELGARSQARKRDISYHTMTKKGTKNKDSFMTIVSTAKKLGINVFQYIKERIVEKNQSVLSLANIINNKLLVIN